MATFDLTLVSALWIVFTLAATGLAVFILSKRPGKRENMAVVALLVQQAVATGLGVALFTAEQPSIVETIYPIIVPVWLLWAPVVFLCGPLLLGGSAGKLEWGLGIAGALPGLGLVGAGLLRSDLIVRSSQIAMTDLAVNVFFLVFVGFAVTVAVLAKEALTTPLPTRRAQFGLLAAAFCVEGGYHAAGNAAKLWLGLDFHGLAQAGGSLSGIALVPVAIYAGLIVWLGRLAVSAQESSKRSWATGILAALLASLSMGVAASGIGVSGKMQTALEGFHVFLDLAALGMIVFAGLRFQLFGVEQKAKRSVAISTAVAGGFLVFVGVQEFAEQVITEQTILGELPSAGILAGFAVGIVAIPLQYTGRRLASRIFPRVREDGSYAQDRNRELYRAAVEGVLADGVQDPEEAESLRVLREKLDIPMSVHEGLMQEVRDLVEAEDEQNGSSR